MVEATFAQVCDAGQIRTAELGAELLRREGLGLSTTDVEQAIIHLRLGLEAAAQLAPGPDQDAVLGYLIETYGLVAALTDPLLRPLLPPIPVNGAVVVRRVLGIAGRALSANGQLLAVGATLIPQ